MGKLVVCHRFQNYRAVTVKPVNTSAAGPNAASICNYGTGNLHGGFMLIARHIQYTDAAAEVTYQEKTAITDIPPGMGKPTFADVKGLGEAGATPGGLPSTTVAPNCSTRCSAAPSAPKPRPCTVPSPTPESPSGITAHIAGNPYPIRNRTASRLGREFIAKAPSGPTETVIEHE